MKLKKDAPLTDTEADMSCEQRYLGRLERFERFYLQLVIFAGATLAAAIGIAVMANVLLGVALAVFCASVYVYFTTDELYKQLGLRYKNENGSLTVTRATAVYGDTLAIPSRLIFVDVIAIGDGALDSSKNADLVRIYIPKSIKYIGEKILPDVHCVTTVLYEGSAEEWEAIEKKTDLTGIEVTFDCDYPVLPPKQKKKGQAHEPQSSGSDDVEAAE